MSHEYPSLVNGQGTPFSIYRSYSETDRPLRVGTKGVLPDGRVFYWARNATAAAVTANQVAIVPAETANHHDQTVTAAADFTAGSRNVTVTVGATAIVLREYEEGYLAITDGTGEGQIFKIERHAGQAGSTTSTAKLYTPVITTTGAASTLSLLRNPYSNLRASATTQTDNPVGVPLVTLAAATAATATVEAIGTTYGWVQTWGPCPVLCDESIAAAGQAIVVGTGVAGAAEEDDTATTVSQEYIIGYSMTPFVDTEFQLVDLRIRP